MQQKLDVAEARLERAQTDVTTGQLALDGQRIRVTDTITSIYEQGDPDLLAFASILDAQTTDDLTRRLEARNVMVGRETRAYDDLHAAEVLLQVRENEVDDARRTSPSSAEAAAERLVTMKGLETEAQKARDKVRSLVRDRRDARQAANQAQALATAPSSGRSRPRRSRSARTSCGPLLRPRAATAARATAS